MAHQGPAIRRHPTTGHRTGGSQALPLSRTVRTAVAMASQAYLRRSGCRRPIGRCVSFTLLCPAGRRRRSAARTLPRSAAASGRPADAWPAGLALPCPGNVSAGARSPMPQSFAGTCCCLSPPPGRGSPPPPTPPCSSTSCITTTPAPMFVSGSRLPDRLEPCSMAGAWCSTTRQRCRLRHPPAGRQLADTCGGYGTAVVAPEQIQNGLRTPGPGRQRHGGAVLSYEGSFTASNGPAQGLTSDRYRCSRTTARRSAITLQLAGNGTGYGDFTWQPPAQESFGTCNPGQSFVPARGLPANAALLLPADGSSGVSTLPTLTAVFSEPVNLRRAPSACSARCPVRSAGYLGQQSERVPGQSLSPWRTWNPAP